MTRAFAHTRGARLWLCGIRAERGAVLCASRVLLPRLCPSCQLGHARGRVACRCCPRVFTRKHVVERACMIVRTDVCLPAQLPGGRIRRRSHGGNRKLALRLRRAGHLLPLSSREPPSHPGAGSVACLPVYRTPGMLTAVAAVAVPHRWLACTPAARRPPPAAALVFAAPSGPSGHGFPALARLTRPSPRIQSDMRLQCVCVGVGALCVLGMGPLARAPRREPHCARQGKCISGFVCVRHASKPAGMDGAHGVKV